jgi:hypothetical protein
LVQGFQHMYKTTEAVSLFKVSNMYTKLVQRLAAVQNQIIATIKGQ